MTVADLTIPQFYGLMVLALAVFWLFELVVREYRNIPMPLLRQKAIFWLGCFFLFGLPLWFGVTALG